MNYSLRRSFVLVGTVLLAIFPVAALYATGPQHSLFLTAGVPGNNWAVQGPFAISGAQQYGSEYPLAVFNNKVRTIGYPSGSFGAEYNPNLTFDGTSFTNSFPPGSAVFDGTTDTSRNYTVDFNSGNVYSTETNWANPTFLFTTAPGFLGITYDPTDNTLWLSNFNSNVVEHRDLFGTLMSSFTVPFTSITCLALDPSDNTLWMGTQGAQGNFYQYSKTGTQLSTVFYPSLTSQDTLGGEFQMPGPATILEVNGNGKISSKISFAMLEVENEQVTPQYLEGVIAYQDKTAKVAFQTGRITSVQASGNEAYIQGNATLKKSGAVVFFTIYVLGNQNPSTNDFFSISLSNGYSASGNVFKGGYISLTRE